MKIFEWSFAGLLAAVALSSGCDVDEVQDGVVERDGVADEADHEELVAAVEPVGASNGWTRYTSEEQMPVNCYPGSAVNAVQCRGSYCDDIRIHCNSTGRQVGGSNWSGYFSESSRRTSVLRVTG